ncbi:MAG: PIN domain-containing protein [Longimicrobiales bacterium]
MIGLDTNVVVRFLVRDDAGQFNRARACIEQAMRGGDDLFLNRIVICELVWVLESAYAYRRTEIADALETILLTKEFVVEDRGSVWSALARYRASKGDLSEYLLAETSAAYDCALTVTFDRSLRGEDDFEVL